MKAQATIEFLVNYAWALLVLAIVIAAILYVGVNDQNNLIPEQCTISNNFPCSSFSLFNDGSNTKVILSISNGFPSKIKIKSLEVYDPSVDGDSFTGFPNDINLNSGQVYLFNGSIPKNYPVKSQKSFNIKILYASCAQELSNSNGTCGGTDNTVSGNLRANVGEK